MKHKILGLSFLFLLISGTQLLQAQCTVGFSSSVSGATVTFTSTTTGPAASYSWDFGDGGTGTGSPTSHVYMAAGWYYVCLTAYDSLGVVCGTAFCDWVYVSTGGGGFCYTSWGYTAIGSTVAFYNYSYGATTYLWDFGDGTTSTMFEPMHTYALPGTYYVCMTAYNALGVACDLGFCQYIYVAGGSGGCTADFSFTNTGSIYDFTNLSTGGYTNIYWDFGDGGWSYDPNPTHVYGSPGTYVVCLTLYDASWVMCDFTLCDTITIVGSSTGCTASYTSPVTVFGTTAYFVNTSSGGYSYYWDFGDGNTSTAVSPTHTYTTPGWFWACLYAFDSLGLPCGPAYCDYVYIPTSTSGCSSYFTYSSSGTTVTFTSGGSPPISSVAWDFGDGTTSTVTNPVHVFPSPGYYYVCMTAFDPSGIPCDWGYCEYMYINGGYCTSGFTYSVTGSTVIFSNTSTGTVGSHYWDFGDFTTSSVASPSHTYATPGMYNVCYTAYDSLGFPCDSTICVNLAAGLPGHCNSDMDFTISGLSVSFSGWPGGSYSSVLWDFGDGSPTTTAMNPVHTYPAPGWWQVCVQAFDAFGDPCDSSACQWMYLNGVSGPCYSYFTYSASGTTVNFTNFSGGTYASLLWDFGDGTTSTLTNPVHNYSTSGWYHVCLTALDSLGNPCDSSYCQYIYLGSGGGSTCNASFFGYMTGSDFQFIDMSYSIGTITSYFWTFGDATTSTLPNPLHTFAGPGPYTVCLTITASDGCTDTYCDTLTGLVGSDDPLSQGVAITAWPNPAQEQLNVAYVVPEAGEARLTMYDLLGHQVMATEFTRVAAGKQEKVLDVSALSRGVYLLKLESESGQEFIKVVKE